ncbi:NAD-dependent protein deacetylase sirtuin-2 [Hemicordylus capensis]|uniref:NAD-dependent protein deacetylase sirtuin-2 n=1 Tax=Hemicordylus capensis TaxID=884348 RepID=UPI002302584C|nr:NAD-dependent protein deacetylase sirtuin-2 [Hemicordylus capensis]
MDGREDPGAAAASASSAEVEAEAEAEKNSSSSSPDSDDEAGASGQTEMDFLRNLLSRTLGLGTEKPEKVLEDLTLEGVSKFMLSEKCKKVICMVGAGISTAAGIPDFRSPGTGLYANLQQYKLPYPEAIFEISYFKQHPEPFFALARELYPGQFKPTLCHYFIRLLKEKGLLLRCYTQNIDTLERVAGLDQEDLVEAHGTFYTSHCTSASCRKTYSLEWMKEKIFSSLIPKCEKCESVVKPDIVFFGENLPSRFFSLMQSDFHNVDLLIIMGTSLQVQPFASLVSRVPKNTPRLLINKEKTGESDPFMSLMGFGCGMDFDSEKAYRDVAYLGDCDEGCLALAELLGWKKELEELVKKEHAAIEAKSGQAVGDGAGASAREQKPKPSPKKESPPGRKAE